MLLFTCQSLWATNITVTLGTKTVTIQKTENGPGKAFIHLHHNETTSLKAAKKVVQAQGGSVITLVHEGGRNIVFHLRGKRYEFDPNRIYTDAGISKTLNQFSHDDPAAHQQVKMLATKIVSSIPDGKIIAVHNNRSYSLKDYLPGHALSREAAQMTMPDKRHFRNFFLVTKERAYQQLKALGFNGVLQASNASDDGSLSVLMANRDYVNIECAYGAIGAQIKMLKAA